MRIVYKIKSITLILIILTGCKSFNEINYPLNNIKRSEIKLLQNYSIDIQVFKDTRKLFIDNDILFKNNDEKLSIDNITYCMNVENNYKINSVNEQFSNMLYKHLKTRAAFKSVTCNSKKESDYYLTGNLEIFSGKVQFSYSASITSQICMGFGCLGGAIAGLILTKTKVPGKIHFKVTNLNVYDKNENFIYRINDFEEIIEDKFETLQNCKSIYFLVNQHLKNYINKLTEKIEIVSFNHFNKK